MADPRAQQAEEEVSPRAALIARRLRGAALALLALVVLYGPVVCGAVYSLASGATFALLLLAAAFCLFCAEVLNHRLRARFGLPAALFAAFLASGLASSLLAENWFAGLRWCLVVGTYGLTAFLVMQLADSPVRWRFFLSCLLASGAALAAYGLWHLAFYMPALRRWLAEDPEGFRAALGPAGHLHDAVASRVAGTRAFGNFITPNQFADFLALTLLPLAGVVAARNGTRAARAGRRAALLLMTVAVVLTRSVGGLFALTFGLVVFASEPCRAFLRRWWKVLLPAAAAGTILLGVAIGAGALPGAASFRVRLDYWRTTARMARSRPILGVGPGTWSDWYTRFKEPEYEETKSAHSAYLQIWAENGAVGILLFLSLWAATLARRPGAPPARQATGPPGESQSPGDEGNEHLRTTGLCAAGAAFLFHFAVMKGFHPPPYVPAWMEATPLLPYLIAYGVWAGVFSVSFRTGRSDLRLPAWGVLAGLAAFLLHSGAEFTLQVPAIGASVAVMAALLIMSGSRPRLRQWRIPREGARAVMVPLAAGVVLFWALIVAGRALDQSTATARAEDALRVMAEPSLTSLDRLSLAEKVDREYQRACVAVPWDDAAWRRRGAWLLGQARHGGHELDLARQAAHRACALNPRHADNWGLLGRIHMAAGEFALALKAYHRACNLFPSLPLAWYEMARAAEHAGVRSTEWCPAYRKALELIPRQYHDRNKILGGWRDAAALHITARDVLQSLTPLQAAEMIAHKARVRDIPGDASPKEKVALLLGGFEGAQLLADEWESSEEQTMQARFWELAAQRVWLWALQAKVNGCETDRRLSGGAAGQR